MVGDRTPGAASPGRLVEQFERGLDAPICLTWELTYACNLACVHCLSALGPARPARADHRASAGQSSTSSSACRCSTSTSAAASRRVRPDFWELVDYATDHHVGVKFSTNGIRITAGGGRAGWPPATTSTCRSRSTAPPREVNDAVRGDGLVRHGGARAMDNLAAAGFGRVQDLAWWSPGTTSTSSTNSRRIADRYGAQLRIYPAAPLGPGRRRLGRAAPDRRAAAARSTTGCVANGEQGADRRLLLPPGRARASPLRRAEPVRRRPGGLPDRPGRRRVRLPVRHPRRVPGRQRARRRAGSPASGGTSALFAELREPQSAGACASLRVSTTPAGAAAWRPSSSPACRWTVPTPSACSATASARTGPPVAVPRPWPTTPAGFAGRR